MTAPTLSPSEQDFFRREGYVRLAGFHARAGTAPLKAQVMHELARLKVWVGGKRLGSPLNGLPPFQQIARLSSMVKVAGVDAALNTPGLRAAVASLGVQPAAVSQGTQLLLSLPRQGDWTLQGLNWHVDLAAPPGGQVPGVQAFHLIDDVPPHGGATLALARSHGLDGDAARGLRAALKSTGGLAESLKAAGIEVVEMSGRAGDLFLMDMRVLHSPSINAGRGIRMMATTRFA